MSRSRFACEFGKYKITILNQAHGPTADIERIFKLGHDLRPDPEHRCPVRLNRRYQLASDPTPQHLSRKSCSFCMAAS